MVGAKSYESGEPSRFRVLLTDDNEDNLFLLSETLDDPSYELVLTRSGEEAIAAAREAPPDIALLDLRMPGINGHETCRRLKADPALADMPVLFLSATDSIEDRLEGFAVGAVDFISKPFYPDEVIARVSAHLKIARLTRELSLRNTELEREIEAAHAFRHELLSDMLAPLQGDGLAVTALRSELAQAGASDGPVALIGATQDGAEAVARAIHEGSSRRWRPFVKALVSSSSDGGAQLLGPTVPIVTRSSSLHERALLAVGGTLYIEGLHALSPGERRQVRERLVDADVRLIVHRERDAVASEPLELSHTIALPELDARREDIPAIVAWIVRTAATKLGRPVPKLAAADLQRLSTAAWPGGIPEIESVVARALLLSPRGRLEFRHELDNDHAGRSLGRYRLQKRLGKGGMGEVWEARHELLSHPVAVKIIAPELDSDRLARAKQRFSSEALAIAQLQSPYTVRIFDFGTGEGGELYYAMELLTGLDLHLMVRIDGPLSPGRAIHLLRQVASSLAEAHACGLVHRDIKPPNLIVSQLGFESDWLKVVDFGIVAVEGSVEDRGMGTPGFVAPELITSRAGASAASDIYALGCCAYWCLTGAQPFAGDSTRALMAAHAREVPPAPSALRHIPAQLDDLVLACLSKRPGDRPSAAELVGRLERLAREHPWTRQDAERWWAGRRGQVHEDVEPNAMTLPNG